MDHVFAKAKPEPIDARRGTRSRAATFDRNFPTSAATLSLPFFRLAAKTFRQEETHVCRMDSIQARASTQVPSLGT